MQGSNVYLEGLKTVQLGPNTAYDVAVAFGVLLASMAILKLIQYLVLAKLKRIAERTKTEFDDVLIDIFRKVRPPFYILVSVYFSVQLLTIPEVAERLVQVAFVVTLLYEIVRAVERLVGYFIDKNFIDKDGDGEPDKDAAMVSGIKTLLRIVLWMIGGALALANLGVNVTSLVASLGIGGIAVALALQNILGDMFSSFTIYLDKPFRVGDFIVIGTDKGTVEHIGLKSTRIRTLQGEQLVVSNKELTSVRIQNFKKMERRRVVFRLGIEYGTPKGALESVPSWIRDIVVAQDLADFDRCHFDTYGDSSLDFEVVFYVDTDDYNAYMNIKERINIEIYEKFQQENVGFAFPTRTVHVLKGESPS